MFCSDSKNGVCSPEGKGEALNLSFAKPPELQVHWSTAPQIRSCAKKGALQKSPLASRDMCELCGCGCLPVLQVPPGESERGGAAMLQPPALGAHQEKQSLTSRKRKSWPSARLNAVIPVAASFPPSLPPHPAARAVWRVASQGTRRGVCVLGGLWGVGCMCCHFAFLCFFACGSVCTCLPAAVLTSLRGAL